jgi:triacylglycerol esterase/lipase EstA (alpha/beta hydrolase family)
MIISRSIILSPSNARRIYYHRAIDFRNIITLNHRGRYYSTEELMASRFICQFQDSFLANFSIRRSSKISSPSVKMKMTISLLQYEPNSKLRSYSRQNCIRQAENQSWNILPIVGQDLEKKDYENYRRKHLKSYKK